MVAWLQLAFQFRGTHQDSGTWPAGRWGGSQVVTQRMLVFTLTDEDWRELPPTAFPPLAGGLPS